MRSSIILLLVCLQLSCLAVFAQVPGGQQNQDITMTPELKALVNAGLKQVNELGGDFATENAKKIVVLAHTTQVVAGTVDKLLVEVRFKRGSKLVSMSLFNQSWTGIVNELTEACVNVKKFGNFYLNACDSATDCQTLLTNQGTCQQVSSD